MADFFFPDVSENAVPPIRVVLAQMRQNPGYLSDPRCPYGPAFRAFLQEVVTSKADGPSDFELADDKLDFIEASIGRAIQDLNTLQSTLGSADHGEKLAVLKAKTGLLEKLIGGRERISSLKEMAQFQTAVIGFLDSICTPDQITQLKVALRMEIAK